MAWRPISSTDKWLELVFPLQGINLATEFELQPGGTTPIGVNVRGYEAMTLRMRGGSRAGLVQYIPATVNGVALVQHLNILIDPTEAPLGGQFAAPPTFPVPTPFPGSDGGTYLVPVGGSGYLPRPYVGPSPPPPPPPPPPRPMDFWAGTLQSGSGPDYDMELGVGGGSVFTATQLTSAFDQPTIPTPSGAIGVFLSGDYFMTQPYWLPE